jgi:hypothetical protein
VDRTRDQRSGRDVIMRPPFNGGNQRPIVTDIQLNNFEGDLTIGMGQQMELED